jgi:hypothetical protein
MHPGSLCYEFCGPGGIVSGFSGDALADVIPREPHAQPVVAGDEIPGEFAVVDRHVACELSRLLRRQSGFFYVQRPEGATKICIAVAPLAGQSKEASKLLDRLGRL